MKYVRKISTGIRSLIYSLAVASLVIVVTAQPVLAAHWPFDIADNGTNPALSKGYFTDRDVTSVGPAVLPPSNRGGAACGTYTYSEWQLDGSPLNTSSFAIPNGAIGAGNDLAGNAARKNQLYSFLFSRHVASVSMSNCLQTQIHHGTSFIVNTLLGRSPSEVGGVTLSNPDWDELRARLNSPSLFLGTINDFSRSENSFAVRGRQIGLGGDNIRDVAYRNEALNEPTIVLRDGGPSGSIVYAIKRRCGNPTGNFAGIPPPPPPAGISCGSLTTAPSNPEPGQSFTVTASFNVGGGAGPDVSYNMWLTLPSAGLNNTQIVSNGSAPRGGTGTGTSPPVSIPDPGQYEGSFRIQASGTTPSTLTCPFGVDFVDDGRPPVPVVSLPYYKVYGGDVHAGSGFREGVSSCTPNQDSALIGWNRGAAGTYAGSGTQLAALAFGLVLDVSSGQIISPGQAKNLTFANTSDSHNNYGAQTYGGGLFAGGNTVCAPDYFANAGEATSTLGATTSANVAPGIYSRNGDLTITGGNLGLGADNDRTFYVDGNVTITGNITYAPGNYNSIDRIPVFRLIVRGNIYISPSVSELSGIFVAQPRAASPDTTGRFYTCWPGGAPSAATMNGICRTSGRLTVYGAVTAEQVKLTRSTGTRAQSTTAERAGNLGSTGSPAEVFIYTPEVWLPGGFGEAELDAFIPLPPVF